MLKRVAVMAMLLTTNKLTSMFTVKTGTPFTIGNGVTWVAEPWQQLVIVHCPGSHRFIALIRILKFKTLVNNHVENAVNILFSFYKYLHTSYNTYNNSYMYLVLFLCFQRPIANGANGNWLDSVQKHVEEVCKRKNETSWFLRKMEDLVQSQLQIKRNL